MVQQSLIWEQSSLSRGADKVMYPIFILRGLVDGKECCILRMELMYDSKNTKFLDMWEIEFMGSVHIHVEGTLNDVDRIRTAAIVFMNKCILSLNNIKVS